MFMVGFTCHINWIECLLGLDRSSDPRCSVKKGVLKNFKNFTGKLLCQSLVFNKVAGLRLATLFKKRLWHRCFPVNFVKFFRTFFYRIPPDDCFWLRNACRIIKVFSFHIVNFETVNVSEIWI